MTGSLQGPRGTHSVREDSVTLTDRRIKRPDIVQERGLTLGEGLIQELVQQRSTEVLICSHGMQEEILNKRKGISGESFGR